ncbi:MAG: cytidine deaminase [Endomicrobium sp.]|jgi:cytidine deaminase|nr:cytidine deaminase [Endomicrobium sp.]
MNTKYKQIIKKAYEASKYSYSPYSNFAVGSAVLAGSGKIYLGTNIENVSYGLTNCAERSALFNAFSNGEKQVKAIVIWTPLSKVFPCGACCQVILELANNSDIIIKAGKDSFKIFKITDLLPHSFNRQNL